MTPLRPWRPPRRLRRSGDGWPPEGNPAVYEADLARLLSNLGNRLAEAGRHPQALEAEQQAVEMRRRQIEGNPGPSVSRPASSLGSLRFAADDSRDASAGGLPEKGVDR